MTLASIIVPAFNVQATMRQTLEALLAQTYADFEIIIVRFGSLSFNRNAVATNLLAPESFRIFLMPSICVLSGVPNQCIGPSMMFS